MGVLFLFIAFIILAYAPGNVKVARRAPVWYAGKNAAGAQARPHRRH